MGNHLRTDHECRLMNGWKPSKVRSRNQQRHVAESHWELLRSAAELNGATQNALTFADYLDVKNRKHAVTSSSDQRRSCSSRRSNECPGHR